MSRPDDRHAAGRPEEMIFTSNLQEFANRIGIICSLESNEKISPDEAYRQIKRLWKQLKHSKKNLLDLDDASGDEPGK